VTGPAADWIGIGLRLPHLAEMAELRKVPVDFVEVHAENYFEPHSAQRAALLAISERVPVSIHGVALSLGSADGLDREHLDRLADLVSDVRPCIVSEHLAWSRAGGVYYNDLLPLPRNQGTLDVIARNVDRAQAALGRQVLVENPSSYLVFEDTDMSEGAFMARLCASTGCGVLLDVNNLHVSAVNVGLDVASWLAEVPPSVVSEIHLAGHDADGSGSGLLVDTHDRPVSRAVWSLFEEAISHYGRRPTLLERDENLPPLRDLVTEARRARAGDATSRP